MKISLLTTLIFAIMLIFSHSLMAQNQTPAPPQSEPIALVGATIHTVSGDVIENGTILFEYGKITAIGTNVDLPQGTRSEDVSGKYIYPGLIDAWSQMGIYEIGAVDMTTDINEQGTVNPNVMVERAFNPESRWIGVGRSAGVLTSITTPGGGLISGQSAAMMMDGWAWDEMTLKSGVGLIVNWPNTNNMRNYATQLQNLRDAFADARAYKTARRAMENGDAPHHDFDTRWNAMIPVFDGERPVVVSADEVRQIQDAITWSIEEGVELIILGGRDAHLVTDQLTEHNIPVIVTTVLTSPNRDWESYDARYSLPAKLHDAGVTFAIAGGPSAPYANRLPFEAGAAAAFGLSPEQALHSLTLAPAQILGIYDRVGSLEVGKDATLLITTGNPIEYATQIEQVYVQGRKSDMMDSHKYFYEKYREKVDQRATN
ncbi:MAG: amidohydrolase family protein [Balneolaceae bacterium]|nr:amidohydrolase family protein [Balneolaceae bacterium]